MKRIFVIGLCLLSCSGAYAQTVAPTGQTPLERMQEDEVSGYAHDAVESGKKHSADKKEEKNTRSQKKHHDKKLKDKGQSKPPGTDGTPPQP